MGRFTFPRWVRRCILYFWMLSTIVGCIKPLSWRPERTVVAQPVEIDIDLPWHGFPGLILSETKEPQDLSVGLVDTGATTTLVSPRYVEANHLSISQSSVRIFDAFGNVRRRVRIARVEHLKIGAASFDGFDAVIDDTGALSNFHQKLDFILAAPLFSDVLLTINYRTRKLFLRNGALPEADGKTILPLKRSDNGHFSLPAKLLGEETSLIVDTGDTANGILLSRYRLIGMRWASTPIQGGVARGLYGTAPSRIGRMDGDVTIGQYTIHRPIIGIAANDDQEMIGAEILRNFTVTIDQRNNRIQLLAPTSQPINIPPLRHLGFYLPKGTGPLSVVPDSEAARAGLKNGDELLTINGIAPDRMTQQFLENLEAAAVPMIIRIKREGQELVLRVPLTTMVQ